MPTNTRTYHTPSRVQVQLYAFRKRAQPLGSHDSTTLPLWKNRAQPLGSHDSRTFPLRKNRCLSAGIICYFWGASINVRG